MLFKRTVSLAVAVSIVTNTLSWAYYVTLINIVMTPKVYAANEIYEQLEKISIFQIQQRTELPQSLQRTF